LAGFLDRLQTVCRFFFETLGGLPGNPVDLVPPSMREQVWVPPDFGQSSRRDASVA
jgi:hypothetical protein